MNQHVCAYLGAVIMAIKSPIHPWAAAAAEVSIAAVLRGEREREKGDVRKEPTKGQPGEEE